MNQPEPVSFFVQIGQYSWCLTFIGVCIALWGWRVARNNALRLATRSESKSLIDAITKLVTEVSDLSIDFWINKSFLVEDSDDVVAREKEVRAKANQSTIFLFNVLAKAQQVSKFAEILALRGLKVPDNLLSNVLEKTTLDCETAYKANIDVRTVRAQEIINSCMMVIQNLHESFQKYHPPANPETLFQLINRKYHEIDDWHDGLK